MPSLWKILFIVVAALLVISLIVGGGLWYQLNATKTQLNVTETQLDTTKTELDSAKTQLDVTKTQLDRAESERNQMLNRYSELRKQINTRFGKGQDCQSFITPNDPAISAKVLEITGGYAQDVNEPWRERWQDYELLYRWVTENIEYTKDSHTPILPDIMDGTLTWGPDFWRMPAETLEDKAGDCEDMAVLLASMLSNYNEERFAIWVLGIQTRAPKYKRHLAVAFPVAGINLTILDPAVKHYTKHSGSITDTDAATAVNMWLSCWKKDMPDAQIYVVFSDKFYREFSGTQEFIEWVHERIKQAP